MGLDPDTAYRVVFEGAGVSVDVASGVSNDRGTLTATFTVPSVPAGDYTIKVVDVATGETLAAAAFRVTPPSGLVLKPNPAAFPGQLVVFEWDTGVATLVPPVYVTVILNDNAYTTVPARYLGTKLYGSFLMPNAPPGTTWVLRLEYSDSRQVLQHSGAATQFVLAEDATFIFDTNPPYHLLGISVSGRIGLALYEYSGSVTGLDISAPTEVTITGTIATGPGITPALTGTFTETVHITRLTLPDGTNPGSITYYKTGTFTVSNGDITITGSWRTWTFTEEISPTGGPQYSSSWGYAVLPIQVYKNSPQTGSIGPVVIKLVSGSGALVVSLTDADVFFIASAIYEAIYDPIVEVVTGTGDRVLARLSDLDARIVEVRDGVALLNTRFGEMSASLSAINATLSGLIVSAKGEVLAKIDTALGTMLARLDDLDARLVAVHGDTAVIRTMVGDIKLTLESLNATIAGIKEDAVVIKTSAGFIKAKVEELIALLPSVVEFVNATIIDIKSGIEAVKDDTGFIKAKVEDVIALLSAASATLSEVAGDVSAVRSDIAAVRGGIAEVKALVLAVNDNVGLVGQAVLVVADLNMAVLDRLDKMNAMLVGVSAGVAKLSTDVDGLASLVKAANLSISQIVVDQAGRIIVALRDSEGRISGLITTNAKTLSDLITAVGKDVAGVADSVKKVSDTLAAFQSGTFSKLDAISGSVDAARADLARLRTDSAAMASVVAGIQTTVSRVDTNVGGLVDTAKAIATTVDSINRAVPGLATKADVSGAQTAITDAVNRAKSDLQSAVKSAETATSTSSRNWGVINAILIIIAIAILAYSTFVARRA